MSNPKALAHLGLSLPIGAKPQGHLLKDFEFGSPLGRLRREMLNARGNPYEATIVALCGILRRLGGVDSPTRPLIEALPAPDIEYLNLAITAARCDGLAKIETECNKDEGGCGGKIEDDVTLADVELLDVEGQVAFDKRGRPYQSFTFVDPETGKEIQVDYRIPTLMDQKVLFEKFRAQSQRREDLQLGDFTFNQIAEMTLDYDRRGRGVTVAELDAMPGDTVDALCTAAGKRAFPHVDVDVIVACKICGREQVEVLPVQQWMLPFGDRRRSPS